MIRYHCFISYTNRESEARELRPLLTALGGAFRSLGVVHAPLFWDVLELEQPRDAQGLAVSLLNAIQESVCMIALVSPSYVSSPWCIFEWGAMSGVHVDRGPEWPAIKPYIWKPLDSADHFVQQVPYETITFDFRALVEMQPLPWKIRNPFGEYLHRQAKREFNVFVGDVLGFIATKCAQIGVETSGELQHDAHDLGRMAEKLSEGWALEDVASRFAGRMGYPGRG